MVRTAVDDGVDGADEGGPGLVVKADDDGGGGQVDRRGAGAAGLQAPGVSPVRQAPVHTHQPAHISAQSVYCSVLC